MYMIYEEIFRYVGSYSRSTELGYVNTEEEAQSICESLNKSVEEKNDINTMGYWRYYFEEIKPFDFKKIKK